MNIEKEIQEIKDRNIRVEQDKSWETSWFRRVLITCVTYIVAGIWLVSINDSNPWLKALVPAVGYFLSTLSLPFIKNWWTKSNIK
jgi:hypothetical protein